MGKRQQRNRLQQLFHQLEKEDEAHEQQCDQQCLPEQLSSESPHEEEESGQESNSFAADVLYVASDSLSDVPDFDSDEYFSSDDESDTSQHPRMLMTFLMI